MDLDFPIAFYSGPGLQNSSLYSKIWICSNGFLCLEGEYTNPNPPSVIPKPQSPNAFIAPYWSDLNPSGNKVRYGAFSYGASYYFGVEWDVTDKANGKRQNFAVYIKKNSVYFTRKQNDVLFQYWNVSWSQNAFWGIEDQEGYRGVGGRGSVGARSIRFLGWNANWEAYTPEIREMTIKLEKEDTNTEIYIGKNFWELSGYNLQWKAPQPAPEPWYYTAIRGGATLLMSTVIGHIFGPVAGFMFGISKVGYETAEAISKSLWQAQEAEIKQYANTAENLAYVKVPAAGNEDYKGTQLSDYPVDALVGAQVYWIFTDNNIEPHNLQITIELKYYDYHEEKTIQTSVDLNIVRDTGNSINDPNLREIASGNYIAFVGIGCPSGTDDEKDFYKIWVKYYQTISIRMQPLASENTNFDLRLYNPDKNLVASSTNGLNASEQIVYLSTCSDGYWYIEVNAVQSSNLYNLEVSVSYSGSCPFVHVWNGTDYAIDNNILAASEISNGNDVEDYYKLEQTLVPKYQTNFFSVYSLQIRESENEHTYIDQTKLLAVNHESDVKIAVSPFGEILTYTNPHPPVTCIDNKENNILNILKEIDGQSYKGLAGDYITLDFGNLDVSNGAKLVLRTDLPPEPMPKCPCIHIQVLNSTGNWMDVATLSPRVYWATDIVDLSNFLSDLEGNIQIRLYFTSTHKIDYVGLDTTPQAQIQINHSLLLLAKHSEEGFITSKLICNDGIYSELLPNQQITLTFILNNNLGISRTFIFYTEGHYYTITSENP